MLFLQWSLQLILAMNITTYLPNTLTNHICRSAQDCPVRKELAGLNCTFQLPLLITKWKYKSEIQAVNEGYRGIIFPCEVLVVYGLMIGG